ncbi:hypothetical protein UT300012_34790 [Paraclostridium bifermentans]
MNVKLVKTKAKAKVKIKNLECLFFIVPPYAFLKCNLIYKIYLYLYAQIRISVPNKIRFAHIANDFVRCSKTFLRSQHIILIYLNLVGYPKFFSKYNFYKRKKEGNK